MASNSPKNRDYFITINQGAPSYENALEIVKDLNVKLYAYIVHDKDTLLDEDGCITPKAIHKHIMLELKNPVSFSSMQKKFEGAHIEVPKYKKSAYQYLVHNRPNAKEKYQYDFSEIISNHTEEVKLIIETETCDLFVETSFLRYLAEGVKTPYQFVKRFGLNAYKQYWNAYLDMLKELDRDPEMRDDLRRLQEELDKDLPF